MDKRLTILPYCFKKISEGGDSVKTYTFVEPTIQAIKDVAMTS